MIGVIWHEHVYCHPQLLTIEGVAEDRNQTGFELAVEAVPFSDQHVDFGLIIDDVVVAKFRFATRSKSMFNRRDQGPRITVHGPFADGTLEELLELRPPTIFLADFSTIVGRDWYRRTAVSARDPSCIRTFRDFATSADIECEVSGPRTGTKSIHEFTETQFLLQPSDVVIYDHRTGEIADFISLLETDEAVICRLAHCKGASGKKYPTKRKVASSRVDDAYEVAGQVVKCLPYRNRPGDLKDKLIHRLASGSQIKRGSVERMERILEIAHRKCFEYHICLVQPGLSAASLNEATKSVLAAAGEYVSGNSGYPVSFWLSE